MFKKIFLPLWIVFISLIIASCSTPTALLPATSTPTITPSQTPLPSATPLPTETMTPVLPTATSTPVVNAIQHFPSGQEFTVTTIHMIDANTGWSIGNLINQDDHVLITSDGGSTWTDVTPPEEKSPAGEQKFARGYFQDTQNAWVIYSFSSGTTPSQSVVWRTQDGGTTWQASQPLDIRELNEFYNPSSLQFTDNMSGWLIVHVGVGMNHDYIVLYRTVDGGLSWERIIDPYNDTTGIMGCSKTGMLFNDATHGWLTGDCNGVAPGVWLYKTTDGGTSWEAVSLPEPPDYPGLFSNGAMVACGSYDPFFFGNDLGYLAVNCQDYQGTQISHFYYLFTTKDGGATWTSSVYPGENIYFFDKDKGWALSKTIERTTDAGLTWTPIATVTWDVQVDFVSDQIGWGVARSDDLVALVKTTDGGTHWSMLAPKVGP